MSEHFPQERAINTQLTFDLQHSKKHSDHIETEESDRISAYLDSRHDINFH